MPERNNSITEGRIGKLRRGAEWLRSFSGQFEFAREVLIFTLFGWCGAFWWYTDNPAVLPYVTYIVIANTVCLAALGIARMIVNPDTAAVRSPR